MTQNVNLQGNIAYQGTGYDDDTRDSLSLRDFARAIRERARIVWGMIILCFALGCLYMIIVKPQYTVTMVVGPAPASSQAKTSASALSSLSGATSAISGLLGTSTTPSTLAPMDEFMQLIESPRVMQKMIDKNPAILPTIFYREWDAKTKTWHPPPGPLSVIGQLVYKAFGLPSYVPPSAQRLATDLFNTLTITEVNTTAMQQISWTFINPKFGVQFMSDLRSEADAIVRKENQDLADKQIEYLQNKLNTTEQLDQRQMLLGLLQNQVMTRMSINASIPYAAMMVQQAVSSDLPTSPNPFIVMTVAIVVGFLFGVFIALICALVWPAGIQRKAKTYTAGWFKPAFRSALEYFFTVPEKVSSNVN
jgi:TRAP-type C4-dicarboxylate transport system permease small subunit